MDLMDYRRKIIANSPHLKSASGAVVSFSDGADLPLNSLNVGIEPVQDLHGQDAPYPAGCGKNFIPYPYKSSDGVYNGITITTKSDGTIHAQGTSTSSGVMYFWLYDSNVIPSWVVAGETYGLRPVASSGKYFLQAILYGSPTFVLGGNEAPKAFPNDLSVYTRFAICIGFYVGAVVDDDIQPIFFKGTTIPSWSPYENICPISGWTQANVNVTGKNQLKAELTKGANSTIALDITKAPMIISGRQYILSFDDVANATSWRIACVLFGANGERIYTGSDITSGTLGKHTSGRYYVTGSNGTLKQATFAANATCFAMFFLALGDISDTSVTVNGQLEFGTVKTDYEARSNQTIPINWQTEAGTVYGGKLDVLSGKLTVDSAINVIDGTQELALNGIQPYGGAQVIYIPNPAKALADSSATQNVGLLSDKFSTSSPYTNVEYQLTGRVTNANVYINMPASVTTAIQARNWFASNPTQVVYKLAEPIEIQLTPHQIRSLYGNNTIFADTGNIALEYWAHP